MGEIKTYMILPEEEVREDGMCCEMTENKVKEIYEERNKVFSVSFFIDFDKRWREMQKMFCGINVDLSEITIAVEIRK